jgi:DNA-binding GntR family transcriptional regulator
MRMAKKPLNLLVDEELIQKARDHGLIISKFLENKLQEYFSFFDAVSNASLNKECGRRDLNPSFKLGKLK